MSNGRLCTTGVPSFTPGRALMIHNAKYPAHCGMTMSDRVAQMGFGMPQSVKEMLYNSADENFVHHNIQLRNIITINDEW